MEFEFVSLTVDKGHWEDTGVAGIRKWIVPPQAQFVRVDQVVAALEGLAAEKRETAAYFSNNVPASSAEAQSDNAESQANYRFAANLESIAANLKPTGD